MLHSVSTGGVMITIIRKYVALVLIFSVWICSGTAMAVQVSAPVGDKAYPAYGSCLSSTVPNLPNSWSANALLTPFQSQPLQVARVSVQSLPGKENRMVVTTDNVQSKGPTAWYIQGNKTYALSNSTGGQLQCRLIRSTPTLWIAPAANFLENSKCSCQGSNLVTGKQSEAWRCPNGQTEGTGTSKTIEYDWYWFSKDKNKYINRIINSRNNNTHDIPIFGDASLVNFTNVVTTIDPLLNAASAACNGRTSVKASLKSPTISGLSYEAKHPAPPTWPNTAFANGALFAVDGSHTSMAIYYDWNSKQEVSKIKSANGSIQDTRLTKGLTYEIRYTKQNARVCEGTLVNVGTWHPKWAHDDNCKYMATIKAKSLLNPRNKTLQAMACYFGGIGETTSNIQAWYSYDGEPVMFYETNAGDLDLIDYYKWIPNAKIPKGVIYPIDSCSGDAQVTSGCNSCHGKAD